MNFRTLRYVVASIAVILLLFEYHPDFNQVSYIKTRFAQSFRDDIRAKAQRRQAGYHKKFDQPDQYIAFHRDIRIRDNETEMGYFPGHKIVELKRMQDAVAFKSSGTVLPWIERGPRNVPGRTRGLVVDPLDLTGRTWIAGSVGGGIWKTTNEGASWENKTPQLPNLAISCIAISPSNPAILYAGTGEGFYGIGMINGDGILKSTDRGETWVSLASTSKTNDFQNVNRIAIHPSNPGILLAATNTGSLSKFVSGIYKSTDGGLTWRKVFNADKIGRVQQILYHPSDFNIQYATVYGRGVYKSTDAGETWLFASNGLAPGGRIEVAIAPTNPQRLFASAEGGVSGNGSDLYISDNAAGSWSVVRAATGTTTYDFLGGQGWFNNTIAISPYDDSRVYVAGVNVFKATMRTGTGTNPPGFLGMDEDNTSSFISLINFGGTLYGGKLEKGSAPADEFVSVEVRFGRGRKQKAHRFEVPPDAGTNGDGGAGVAASLYQYKDYVDVPFEVWDITNNRQLMVSFRDQERNGVFDLEKRDASIDSRAREYVFISSLTYDQTPHGNIARNGGHTFKQMYFFWPVLPDGGTWAPDDLPDSYLRIKWGSITIRYAEYAIASDAYSQHANPGKNNYEDSRFHPDHHNLILIPVNQVSKTMKMLVANDGGVFLSKTSTDPGLLTNDFIFKGLGYNTAQFYGADKSPWLNRYIGGTQDNGTWISPLGLNPNLATDYEAVIGGDGFETVWHYKDPIRIIGGSQYNNFRRTINGGASWASARSGLSDFGSGNAPFVSRLANSKNNPDVLFTVGKTGVWKSDDFGASWNSKPISQNWSFGSYSNVKVSVANYNIIWAGGAMRSTGNIYVSKDGGDTFNPTTNFTQTTLGRISGLGTHPTEDSTAYVLFSFAKAPKVLRTTNLGNSWEDISGYGADSISKNGFPDVAVYSLIAMPQNPKILWAGTEIGIIESTDNGTTWALANNGLPAVSVWELKVVDDQVIAATHGRGIWSVTIPEINRVPFITEFRRLSTTSRVDLQINMRDAYDSVQVFVNRRLVKTYRQPLVGMSVDVIDLPYGGSHNCYALSWISGVSYKSSSMNINGEPSTSVNKPVSETRAFLVYPNPAKDQLFVELEVSHGRAIIEMFTLSGQRVLSVEASAQNRALITLPASLQGGQYLLRIRQGQNQQTHKIVVVR